VAWGGLGSHFVWFEEVDVVLCYVLSYGKRVVPCRTGEAQ